MEANPYQSPEEPRRRRKTLKKRLYNFGLYMAIFFVVFLVLRPRAFFYLFRLLFWRR